jgi:hypothetical protein
VSPRYFRGGTIRLRTQLSALLDCHNTGENYVLTALYKFNIEKPRYGLLSVIWITNTEVIFPIGATASTI